LSLLLLAWALCSLSNSSREPSATAGMRRSTCLRRSINPSGSLWPQPRRLFHFRLSGPLGFCISSPLRRCRVRRRQAADRVGAHRSERDSGVWAPPQRRSRQNNGRHFGDQYRNLGIVPAAPAAARVEYSIGRTFGSEPLSRASDPGKLPTSLTPPCVSWPAKGREVTPDSGFARASVRSAA
jgi:hypothetical protein